MAKLTYRLKKGAKLSKQEGDDNLAAIGMHGEKDINLVQSKPLLIAGGGTFTLTNGSAAIAGTGFSLDGNTSLSSAGAAYIYDGQKWYYLGTITVESDTAATISQEQDAEWFCLTDDPLRQSPQTGTWQGLSGTFQAYAQVNITKLGTDHSQAKDLTIIGQENIVYGSVSEQVPEMSVNIGLIVGTRNIVNKCGPFSVSGEGNKLGDGVSFRNYINITGNQNTCLNGRTRIIGDDNISTEQGVEIVGNNNNITAEAVKTEGDQNTISASDTNVKGNLNVISGSNHRIVGNGNVIPEGVSADIEGNDNTSTGIKTNVLLRGSNNTLNMNTGPGQNPFSYIYGSGNTLNFGGSEIFGNNNTTSAKYQKFLYSNGCSADTNAGEKARFLYCVNTRLEGTSPFTGPVIAAGFDDGQNQTTITATGSITTGRGGLIIPKLVITDMPMYADDAAAGLAGEMQGTIFRTPTGQVMWKL